MDSLHGITLDQSSVSIKEYVDSFVVVLLLQLIEKRNNCFPYNILDL